MLIHVCVRTVCGHTCDVCAEAREQTNCLELAE